MSDAQTVGLEKPCDLHLANGRLLIIGSGAIGAANLPGWCAAIRRWYGWDIRVLLTPTSAELVSTTALAAATGNKPYTGGFIENAQAGVPHKQLASWPDLIIVAPASLNFISRSALYLTDSLAVYASLLAEVPVVVAPSVPSRLWRTPGVQGYASLLRARGWTVLDPAQGVAVSESVIDEGALPNIYDVVRGAQKALEARLGC